MILLSGINIDGVTVGELVLKRLVILLSGINIDGLPVGELVLTLCEG